MRFISELRYHLFRIPDQDTTKMKSARVLSKRNTFASMQTNIWKDENENNVGV